MKRYLEKPVDLVLSIIYIGVLGYLIIQSAAADFSTFNQYVLGGFLVATLAMYGYFRVKNPFGMKQSLYMIMLLLAIAVVKMGWFTQNMLGALFLLSAMAIVFGEVGNRLPLWKEFIGGGPMLIFLAVAILKSFSYLTTPEIAESINSTIVLFMDEADFLDLFISVLIVGSILSIDKNSLIKSFAGYIPVILAGIFMAGLFGVLIGLAFGIAPDMIIVKYVLPIMGGGNGGGAVPLSEIYASVTGEDASSYYSFAIAILTMGNIVAVFIAAILKRIGEDKPQYTGNGELMMSSSDKQKLLEDELAGVETNDRHLMHGIVLAALFYTLANFITKIPLPGDIGGVDATFGAFDINFSTPITITIHRLAYMIVLLIIASMTGLIPKESRVGAKKLQTFFTKQFMWVLMAGVGIAFTDLVEMKDALTVVNFIVASVVVLGAVVGTWFCAYAVKFYPIESALSAGLCMANRGGSGDVQILTAADRMSLMSYAQISSRIGGGMVLVIASIIFGVLL